MSNGIPNGRSLELGVASPSFAVEQTRYPWINAERSEVPLVPAPLHDGSVFYYGSLIGLNKTISDLAGNVSDEASKSAQQALFMGLPSILRGNRHQGIRKVENAGQVTPATLLWATRNLDKMAALIFAVESPLEPDSPQVVLRLGISNPGDDRKRMLGAMGIRPSLSRGRRKSN